MGQFEYAVPLSSVKPEDIETVAREYLANKTRKREAMLRPLQDKIVVEVEKEAEKTTSSGLVIPGTAQEKPNEATVVAVGPGITLDNGYTLVPDLKPGDKVVFSKYQGTEIEYEGAQYIILAYRDIFAVVE
jgi:chaperonin GroES